MSKIPVSVCIIAKNEEKHIEECLKRLKPYGFEIIVTDTGSTDRTKEIAQRYADKVLDFELILVLQEIIVQSMLLITGYWFWTVMNMLIL